LDRSKTAERLRLADPNPADCQAELAWIARRAMDAVHFESDRYKLPSYERFGQLELGRKVAGGR
jgi:hypothetical protein